MPHGAIPYPFGSCKICSDKATGVHYGVATCEGCKGFFKRSIPKADKYKCFFGNNCVISPQNRNRCKSCRFKKCLYNGMAVEAVKMGRIPKVEKDKALKEVFGSGIDELEQATKAKCSELNNSDSGFKNGIPECSEASSYEVQSGTSLQLMSNPDNDKPSMQSVLQGQSVKSATLVKKEVSHCDGNANLFTTSQNFHIKNDQEKNSQMNVDFEKKSCDVRPVKKTYYSPELIKVMFDQLVGSNRDASVNLLQRLQNNMTDRQNDGQANSMVEELLSLCELSGLKNSHNSPTNLAGINSQYFEDCDEEDLMSQIHGMLQASQIPPQNEVNDMPFKVNNDSDVYSKASVESDVPFTGTYYGYSIMDSNKNSQKICSARNTMSYKGSTHHPFSAASQHMAPYQTRSSFSESYTDSLSASLSSNSDAVSSKMSDISGSPESTVDSSTDQIHQLTHMSATWSLQMKPTTLPYIEDLEHTASVPMSNSTIPSVHNSSFYDNNTVSSYHFNTHITPSGYTGPDKSFLDIPKCPSLSSINSVTSSEHTGYTQDSEKMITISENTTSNSEHTEALFSIPMPCHDISFNAQNQLFNDQTSKSIYFESCGSEKVKNSSRGGGDERLSVMAAPKDESLPENSVGENVVGLSFEQVKEYLSTLSIETNLQNNISWEDIKEIRTQKKKHPVFQKTDSSMKELWNQLMLSIPDVSKRIIGFSKSVPGFDLLCEEDREILLKRAYYDIWMIVASRFLIDGESYLAFKNKTFYTRNMMEHLLSKDFIRMMFTFADQLNSCKLNELQISILCAIRIFTAGDTVDSLKNGDLLREINSFYLDLLANVIADDRPNSGRVLIDLFRILPELDEINRAQQQTVANFDVSSPPLESDIECCLDQEKT